MPAVALTDDYSGPGLGVSWSFRASAAPSSARSSTESFGAGGRCATGAERFQLRELRLPAAARTGSTLQRTSAVTALVAAILFFAGAAAGPKVETIGPPAEGPVPAAVRSALETQGARVTLAAGAPTASCGCARASRTRRRAGAARLPRASRSPRRSESSAS